MDMKSFINLVASGEALNRSQAEQAFEILMSGEATPSQIGAFLMGLRQRGETTEEIAGAVSVMRSKMVTVSAPENAIDIVGTGGDGSGTYNISTASAIVCASAGVPVAKHGNRAASSKSGTADALSVLGVNLDATPETIETCIAEAGIGFMFAQKHHSAMRHVMPTRVEMGTRTIFNLLGPLSNPAGVRRQLLGVFAPEWITPIAEALNSLGCEAAWVVHGSGLDELTTTGSSQIAEIRNGKIKHFEITPEEVGLRRVELSELQGGDADHNADALSRLLDGEKSAYRDVVLLNTAAALVVSDVVDDLKAGIERASEAIDSGASRATLDRWADLSHG